jgi:hypothetical protein
MMLLVSSLSSTLWAMTFDIMVCKVMGIGIYIFIVMSMMLPACLAMCRHAGLCSVHELPVVLRPLKTRKGILALNAMFWTYGIFFMWPFLYYDKFGLDAMGCCGVTEIDTLFLWIYYLVFIGSPLFIAYAVTFIFYRKLDQWVRETSALMTMTSHTRESLTITRNVMRMIKWLLFVPIVCFYPAHTCETLLRIFPNFVSVGTARLFMITFSLPHVCDPIITLIFVKRYRMALVSLLMGGENVPDIPRVVTRRTTNGGVATAPL